MNALRKDGSKIYKNIKYTYSVYGKKDACSGNATITVHYDLYTEESKITLNSNYPTLDDAENAIVACVMSWIDNAAILFQQSSAYR
jgi:hypothetical protein